MQASRQNVVTGGLSYIGKYISQRLVSQGEKVLVLTGHPKRPNPFGNAVEVVPFQFENEDALSRNLQGATTFFNTYCVVPHRIFGQA